MTTLVVQRLVRACLHGQWEFPWMIPRGATIPPPLISLGASFYGYPRPFRYVWATSAIAVMASARPALAEAVDSVASAANSALQS